ncbi:MULTISPECIES: DUF1656 domain-containing protein [unclassified Halomonas]|uniref:DUF1656 domain-containing protein n=1 Tax=unclassified Halomonas TaxID=2609666 RepID=UPI0020A14F76|nr:MULTISPECIES: DUF1656 domain-containing protein [unclassified Halomonas]MCP1314770.1 DUF1656 domain-containing protein [Halomonas sp. 707D7]MCP1327844.1 DUF1656 domain-containing protein [Halomonas sp. 707D4]
MGLQEIAIGGIFISPLLLYALLGFIATLLLRTLLHLLAPTRPLWFEAWFDVSLFVIATALITFVFTVLLENP